MDVRSKELLPVASLLVGGAGRGEDGRHVVTGRHGLAVEHGIVDRVPLGGCGL